MNTKIRSARVTDARAIRKLIRLYPDRLVQDYVPATKFFFVAEACPVRRRSLSNGVGKTIVACCALEIYSKKIAEIRSLSVRPDYQGQGIATALVAACVDRAKKKKIKEVLAITGAVKLFEKSGFSTLQHEKYAMLKMLR